MLIGMRSTERITVTLPSRVAEKVRADVEAGAAASISGYVTDVLVERFHEENVDRLVADMEAVGGPMTDEARDWAREIATRSDDA
jgi:hypothetical protein